jgi:hypothetical protein
MTDFSNISKRSDGLAFARLIDSIEPSSHVIVDSTGLKARNLPQQISEAQASVRLLNSMTQRTMPNSVRIE